MSEYRLDVRPILDEVGAGVEVSDTLDLGTLVVGEESFPLREPAYFDVSVSNAGDGIVAIGSVTAPVRATCARCLCEFDHDIVGDVEGYWPRPGHEIPEEGRSPGSSTPTGASISRRSSSLPSWSRRPTPHCTPRSARACAPRAART
jgi:hypothetical protein